METPSGPKPQKQFVGWGEVVGSQTCLKSQRWHCPRTHRAGAVSREKLPGRHCQTGQSGVHSCSALKAKVQMGAGQHGYRSLQTQFNS